MTVMRSVLMRKLYQRYLLVSIALGEYGIISSGTVIAAQPEGGIRVKLPDFFHTAGEISISRSTCMFKLAYIPGNPDG